MSQPEFSTVVDLHRYPVDQLDNETGVEFARQCRDQYQKTGLCVLPDFVLPDAQDHLVREAGEYIDDAYFCDSAHDVYLTENHDGTDRNSAINRQEQTFVGSIAYDLIPQDSLLKCLYQWDPLKNFVGYVLGKNPFYRFSDPFGACSVNVFVEGGRHGWHFDESEYTVTLMLQAPESGGEFEYVPLIRGLENETGIVSDVLNGDRQKVVKLPFTPGTLLIFGGRQTLHRVTQVSGRRPRLVPVICYSESPGMQNSEAVRRLFWGRANPGDPLICGLPETGF